MKRRQFLMTAGAGAALAAATARPVHASCAKYAVAATGVPCHVKYSRNGFSRKDFSVKISE